MCAAPVWAGFEEGTAAYERGDYATTLNEWRPLAEQGDPTAQHHLGWLYIIGHGVPRDYRKQSAGYARQQCREIVTPRPIWEVSICWEIDFHRIIPKL